MANVYGANAQKILVDSPAGKAAPGEAGGVVRNLRDVYTFTADLASGDVIFLGAKLPKGARILEASLYFTDLDTTGGTIDVGWQASDDGAEAADTDGLFDGVDVATAADNILATQQSAAQLAKWKTRTFAGDVQIVAVTDGDTDVTSGSIVIDVTYVVD